MKLPNYVHPLPAFLNFLGAKGYTFGLTGTIFLREEYYEGLKSDNPKPFSVSLLIHEETHRKNMNLSTSLKYAFSRKARLSEELNAFKAQFAYLKKHRQTYDLDYAARKLSGPMYFYATNYESAKKELKKIWEEA